MKTIQNGLLKLLKKMCYCGLMMFAMLNVVSCNRNDVNTDKVLENFKFSEDIKYQKSVFLDTSKKLEKPEGIACTDKGVYLVDKKRDCIELYNYDGVIVDSIGETGNAEGQLLSPTAIAVGEDNTIYVAEEGNKRITCYDKEHKFVECYNLKDITKDKSAMILDVEVGADKTVYCTIASYNKKVCGLYTIKNGKLKKQGTSISGMLGTDEEHSLMKYVQKYKWGQEGFRSATGYIGSIQNNKIVEKVGLPEGYSATDILILKDNMYLFSGGYATLDRFTLDGKYIETVYSEIASMSNRGLGYFSCDEKGNFYITDSENNEVYKLSPK